jgi:hypothetical protein
MVIVLLTHSAVKITDPNIEATYCTVTSAMSHALGPSILFQAG